jgi:CRISPR-associated endonuclease Csy4
MDHYTDIIILPDPEFPATVLLNSLYAKLHKALHDLASTNIGVSFPKYRITLGNVLRIHGEQSALHDLQGLNWIGGMSGYCAISAVTPVPSGVKFRTVARKQPTMSQAKLNRLIKRGSITEDEIKNYKAQMFSKGLDNPYVELNSGSNGQKHRRYIEFGELQEQPVPGKFDQFGLSRTATIPWFD